MPNRFLFSLRFSSKVYLKLAKLVLLLLLYMTLMRLNFFFLVIFHAGEGLSPLEVLYSLFTGFRFDLLTYGFLFIPVYFLILFQIFSEKWPRFLFGFYKVYLGTTWLLICLLTYVDFFHFTENNKRMRFNDYMALNFDVLQEQILRIPQSQTLLFSTLLVSLTLFGLSSIRSLKWGEWKDEYSPHPARRLEIITRLLVPLLVIFLAARGTLEPHHLKLEHSYVSENTALNELALNAVWCFDK